MKFILQDVLMTKLLVWILQSSKSAGNQPIEMWLTLLAGLI